MIEQLERYFEPAPLPNWFYAFAVNPQKAIDDLLFNRFPMDSFTSDEPNELLIDWANLISGERDFHKLLDYSLERWVKDHWGTFPKGSGGRLALAWCRLADIVAFVEGLDGAAAALLERFDEREQYLGALSDGPSRDALGRYLFAIAQYQKDRRLGAFWWELCEIRGATPFYHGRYAIAGLRGLPAPGSLKGGFRTDVALGLLKLGRALERLVSGKFVSNNSAEQFFLSVSWHTVAAYPPRSAWQQLFIDAVKGASEPLGKWLRKVLPDLDKPARNVAVNNEHITRFNPQWADRGRQLEIELARAPQVFLSESEKLIAEQRAFAQVSGDGRGFAAALCALSRGIRRYDAVRAAKWAEEAKDWNPSDARTWTHWIKALEVAGDVAKANSVAWGMLERFPENPYVYSELIHLLLISGQLEEGEQLALEAVEQFPANPYPYSLLAAILERLGKHSQAEAVLRSANQRFLNNYRWWVDLARALVLQGKLDDAVVELQRAVDKFPNERFLWNFLGGVLSRLNRLPESEETLRTAATRFQDDVTKVSLAGTIRRQGVHRLKEALVVIDEVLSGRPGDIYAMAEKARILGDLGELEQAASMMEELRRRDAQFINEEPDVLADFLAADLDRQQDELNSGVVVNQASSLINPLEAAVRVTPEVRGIHQDSIPVASQGTGVLPKPAGVKSDELDAGEPSFGTESAGKPTTLSRDRDDTRSRSRNTRHTGSPSVTRRDQWELASRVSEARLLRKWARRNELTNEPPTPAELRQKASRLVDGVLSQVPNHPTACAEKANLLIESGSLEAAYRFLENGISLMPSAFGLHQALARVNRELTIKQNLKFDNERYAILTKPLLYLQQRNAAFKPLAYLARGRICFAMYDGQELRHTAARDFEHVREYIAERPQVDGEFHAWWSERIRNLLFSKLDSQAPLTTENVETLKQCSQENSRRIDVVEEQFTLRMSR